MSRTFLHVGVAFLLALGVAPAQGQVTAQHAGAGHGALSGGSYTAHGSAGLAVAGVTGTDPEARAGFWYVAGSPSAACALAWSLTLTGTDNASANQSLTLGQSGTATAGLDKACGEEGLPPPPVQGFTDLRFVDTGLQGVSLGEGARKDIRPDDAATGTSQGGSPPFGAAAPATWKIKLTSDDYPLSFSWDDQALASALSGVPVQLVDASTGGSVVSVNMKQTGSVSISNTGVAALRVVVNQTITQTISLSADWNLASIPLKASDQSFQALLQPTCQSGFLYDPGTGYVSLNPGDDIPPGRGGFFKCSAGSVKITGTVPSTSGPALKSGWNIVGPFATDVPVSGVASAPSGLIQSSFFGLDPNKGYVTASTLTPGEGFWVEAGGAGTLDLSGSKTKSAVANARTNGPPAAAKTSAADALRLRVTDAEGRRATLRFVSDLGDRERARAALPPTPPGDLFDVRFASGRTVVSYSTQDESASDAGRTVDLQGLRFPVELRFQGASEEDQILRVATPGGREHRLTSSAPSVRLPSETSRLTVGLSAAPADVQLRKSFPNPAAERATIEYTLPEATTVQMQVYDVLGRRVARLVDDRKQAGIHRVEFDASAHPSGTYFVRMKATGVMKTRRLSIVK